MKRVKGSPVRYQIVVLLIPLFGMIFIGSLLFTSGINRNLNFVRIYQSSPEAWKSLQLGAPAQDNSAQDSQRKFQDVNVFQGLTELFTIGSDFPMNVNRLEQENPILQKYVLFRHLTPPSKEAYNLPGAPESQFKNGMSASIANLFANKRNGTFIEAGAYDGVAASNTLYFEKVLGWTGLLVECNPMTVPYLKLKKRKAWIADVCLSPTKYPAMTNFSNPTKWTPSAKMGTPVDLTKWGVQTDWTQFQVTAIPLFSLLSAINLTKIDFFSLDVEGAEFDILKTILFDKVHFTVLLLEVHHFSNDTKRQLHQFLKDEGYSLYTDFGSDQLYVHSSYGT